MMHNSNKSDSTYICDILIYYIYICISILKQMGNKIKLNKIFRWDAKKISELERNHLDQQPPFKYDDK